MSLETLLEKVERIEALLISENQKCSPVCANFENIKKSIEELSATRKQLVTSFAMEEQTVSVVRRLNEKWRENTDEISKLKEHLENMTSEARHMNHSFKLLYDRLIDVINCPFPELIHKLHQDKIHGNTDDKPAA